MFVDSNIAILVTAVSGGAARFNGESDLRFTQFEGGRFVQIATDVYGLVYDNTDVNMLDNYVDTVSATKSGNIVTLTLGRNGTLSDLTTTFNVGDDVTPPAATADIIYYGLSTSNNPAAVATASLTTETDPTNPDTISTGLTTAGQYFILLVPSAHDVVSIFDTVLNQDVTTLFTRTASVRTLNGEIYNSYVIGALNAGVNEEYVINF